MHGQKVWTSTAQVANKIMLLTPHDQIRRLQAADRRHHDSSTPTSTAPKIDVQRIPKMGRKAVDSNAIFIDGLFIPDEDRIGEEGKGFSYILHSLNPERILIAAEAIGIGQDALRRATRYAKERVVFDRPIGAEPGHPASAGGEMDVSRIGLVDGDEARPSSTTPADPAGPRPTARNSSARAPVTTRRGRRS